MFYYILLFCMPIGYCCQNFALKQYNIKNEKPNTLLFSACTTFIAICFFLVSSGFDLQFDVRLIPYAMIYGVAYASAWVGTVLALRFGLMAISNMIISCSLLFPTVYGIIYGEPITPTFLVALVLLFTALVLVNLKNKQIGGKFSFKWLACVLVALVGNGSCSVAQNMHKRALGESFKHEFLLIALSISFVLLMTYVLFTSKNLKQDLKACAPYASLNGLSNAALNLTLATLIGHIPNTVLYPTNSLLGMLATFLLAFFHYKERFTKTQYIGYVLGLTSIVLLNL